MIANYECVRWSPSGLGVCGENKSLVSRDSSGVLRVEKKIKINFK